MDLFIKTFVLGDCSIFTGPRKPTISPTAGRTQGAHLHRHCHQALKVSSCGGHLYHAKLHGEKRGMVISPWCGILLMTVLIPTNGGWITYFSDSIIDFQPHFGCVHHELYISLSIPIHPIPMPIPSPNRRNRTWAQVCKTGSSNCDCKWMDGKKALLISSCASCEVRIDCMDAASETEPCSLASPALHSLSLLPPRVHLGLHSLAFFLFSFWFSFSCFLLHATATWKERSSSASEWSLGFTLKCRWLPPRSIGHATAAQSGSIHPGYGTLGWNTGSSDRVATGLYLALQAGLLHELQGLGLGRSLLGEVAAVNPLAAVGTDHHHPLLQFLYHDTPGTSLLKLGSCGFGSLRMPFSTSSARKALAASRASASAWASEMPGPMKFFTKNCDLFCESCGLWHLVRKIAHTKNAWCSSIRHSAPHFALPHWFSGIDLASAPRQVAGDAPQQPLQLGLWSFRLKVSPALLRDLQIRRLPRLAWHGCRLRMRARRSPFSSKAQPWPAQTEVGRSLIKATSWYNPCCWPCSPDAGSTEQRVALWENAMPHLVVLHSNIKMTKWSWISEIWWWDELLCWLGTILLCTPWCITSLQKPLNDKLCTCRESRSCMLQVAI